MLSEFTAAVDGKNLPAAKAIRDRFILAVQDPEFDLILNRYVSLREDIERAEAEKKRLAKIADLTKQLSSVGATDYDQAFTIYAQLVSLEPTNKLYKQKLDRFVKARDEKAAKEAEALAASQAKAERKKKIEAREVAGLAHHDGIAVSRRFCRHVHADIAAGARPVVHDDGPLQCFSQLVGDHA